MTHSTLLKSAAAAVLPLLLAGACSSSGGSGGKAAFCKTNSEIDERLRGVKSLDEQIAALKELQPKFDSYVANAPADVKSDARTLVDAARKAVETNDATPLQTDAGVRQAGPKIDAFCGVANSASADANPQNTSTSIAAAPAEFSLTVADGWAQNLALEGTTGYDNAAAGASLRINRTLDDSDLAAYLDAAVAIEGMHDPSEAKPVAVGGGIGLSREGDFEAKGVSGHISFTVVQHGGNRYTIVYTAPSAEVFLAHATEVKAMLDSLTFTA